MQTTDKNPTTNDFETLLNIAKKSKWCIKWHCTTCGSQEFRREINKYFIEDSQSFLQSIYDYNFASIANYHEFTGAIQIAFHDMGLLGKQSEILNHWLYRSDLPLRLADYILFYIVQYSVNVEVKSRWISKYTDFAISQRDFSLTETLLLLLKQNANDNKKLIEFATEFSMSSAKLKNIMNKFS